MHSHCHVGFQAPLGWKVFQSPIARTLSELSRVIAREYEKALCACVSFCFWLEMHKLQFNLSRIFKKIYEMTVFVINWARCEVPSYFLTKYEQRMSPHLSRADSTVGFFFWLYYSSDWIHLQNSNFSISSLSGCKRYKRWNYRMIKSNLLGLQSKLWIRWPLSFGK